MNNFPTHINVDKNLAVALLENSIPSMATLRIEPVKSTGTDHSLFRLGKDYVMRIPRVEWTPNTVNTRIQKEYYWLSKIQPHLKYSITEPVFIGSPTSFYPFYWLICKWQEGINPDPEAKLDLIAKDMAEFLNSLQQIPLEQEEPISRRGIPLISVDKETKDAISRMEGNTDNITAMWNSFIQLLPWSQKPLWVHGDLLPGNILVKNDRLSGVIDFSDMGIGDPACDLIIAWSLFNPEERRIFRSNLKNIDDTTWHRGIGWALSIAVRMLVCYKESNIAMANMADRMIKNLVAASRDKIE